jgi:hypothetical protein
VRVRQPTPELFRGLARSSPWRWRTLAFDLHRRPLHGPEHTVHALVERGVGVEVRLADGERHTQPAARRSGTWIGGDDRQGVVDLPFAWELPAVLGADGFVVRRRPARDTTEDPMWQDYQFVAMLDPVELADGYPRRDGPPPGPDAVPPPALDVHRVDGSVRHGRATWWAEVSPREDYAPRCSCCPLLFGRVSDEIVGEEGGPSAVARCPDLVHTTRYLVALDLATGVCVHVEHLDGDLAGRGFSVTIRSVDGRPWPRTSAERG